MKSTASFVLILGIAAGTCMGQAGGQESKAAAPAPAALSQAPAQASAVRIASVDSLLLVDLLLESGTIKAERDARGKACQETFNAEQKKLMDIEAKLLMGQLDDPKRQEMIKDWEGKKKSLNEVQAQLTTNFDRFNSLKAAEAWNQLNKVVARMAKERGYTHVFSCRRDVEFLADTQAATVQQLLAHQLMVYPAGDDLTMAIVEELKLQPQLQAKQANEAKAMADAAEFLKQPAPAPAVDPNKDAPKIPMAPKESGGKKSGLPTKAPGFPAPAPAAAPEAAPATAPK
jgi:Skp family chaperone for outer membrane proteins